MEGPVGSFQVTRSGSTSNPEIAAWKIVCREWSQRVESGKSHWEEDLKNMDTKRKRVCEMQNRTD